MSTTSDNLSTQIARLRQKQRAQEKREYEAFGREVTDLLAPSAKASDKSTTARIKAARAKLSSVDLAVHGHDGSVAHEDDGLAAHDRSDSVAHSYGDPVAHNDR